MEPFSGMRRVKQISLSHCGPAVLVALFSFLGARVSQRAITRSLRAQNKIKKYGFVMKEMARAAKIYGGEGKFVFWQKRNTKISDVDLVVNKYRFPVGVEWQGVFYENEDEDNGHYCIVTEIDKKQGCLWLSDPFPEFTGVDRKFKIGFFRKRWWDVNMIKGRKITDKRMMFVIVPRGEIWPKKLGMRRG